jgi:CO/xanthine dehydrogenase Mo-binding subunit
VQIHAALLALRTARPVKMVYSREESFVGHIHRHPSRIRVEHHATRDGRLVAMRMHILLDGGAYANACCFATGPYAVDNVSIDGTVVYTNNPPCGAMRGFGAVQATFAAEAQMDRLAAALDIDPVELRLLNALEPGGVLPTGQVVTGSLPTKEVIRRAAAIPVPEPEALPREPVRLPGGSGNTTRGEGVRRGVGFALGFKNICFSEGFDDYCTARVRLFPDGRAEVHCAAAEVGQGITDVMLRVARSELGTDDVVLVGGSTAHVGSSGSTSASRGTWMAAGAVQLACRAALEERERTGSGDVDVERVYRHPRTFPLEPETGQVTGGPSHVAFAVAAMRAAWSRSTWSSASRAWCGSAPRRTSATRSTGQRSRGRSREAPRRVSASRSWRSSRFGTA